NLAVIYKKAWKDEQGYAEIVKMLPSIWSCKEIFITDFFNGAEQNNDEIQDCLVTLSCCLTGQLRDYVAYGLPNEEDKWDAKLGYFERTIDFLKFISGILNEEKAVGFNRNIAMLYRYMATYYVAQGKKDETLTSLENMLSYLEKDVYGTSDLQPHNIAWYFLPYMEHERYDTVREEKRFIDIKEKIEKLAK
ncbi:MAG: hypothetical protein K6E47_14545, partial [Lachnospiraceae bacterium]|nr:hypothetical protein [Lachnospiraceae bacterium]